MVPACARYARRNVRPVAHRFRLDRPPPDRRLVRHARLRQLDGGAPRAGRPVGGRRADPGARRARALEPAVQESPRSSPELPVRPLPDRRVRRHVRGRVSARAAPRLGRPAVLDPRLRRRRAARADGGGAPAGPTKSARGGRAVRADEIAATARAADRVARVRLRRAGTMLTTLGDTSPPSIRGVRAPARSFSPMMIVRVSRPRTERNISLPGGAKHPCRNACDTLFSATAGVPGCGASVPTSNRRRSLAFSAVNAGRRRCGCGPIAA